MKKVLKGLVCLIIALTLFIGGLFLHNPKSEDYVLDETLYKQVSANDDYITLDQLPKEFIDILVANEDRRFYEHVGVDLKRTAGAAIGNIKAGDTVTGGSTITQQLSKNLFYSQEQTYTRKMLELGTALRLEYYFSKEQIIEMYINVIYYGSDAYGIKQAAEIYFNKLPSELTLDECAVLVGLLPAPSVYNPIDNPDISQQRKEEALKTYREEFQN